MGTDEDRAAAPAKLDWTQTSGSVSAVKDQAQCGSCWAFSATEGIESGLFHTTGQTSAALSAEQIVQCDTVDGGCQGGDLPTAFDYVEGAGGITTAAEYPYEASTKIGITKVQEQGLPCRHCHRLQVRHPCLHWGQVQEPGRDWIDGGFEHERTSVHLRQRRELEQLHRWYLVRNQLGCLQLSRPLRPARRLRQHRIQAILEGEEQLGHILGRGRLHPPPHGRKLLRRRRRSNVRQGRNGL